jgi:hypothetical protein
LKLHGGADSSLLASALMALARAAQSLEVGGTDEELSPFVHVTTGPRYERVPSMR